MSELRSLDPGDSSANKTMAQAAGRLGSSLNPYPYDQRTSAGPHDFVQSAPGSDIPMFRAEQQIQERHGTRDAMGTAPQLALQDQGSHLPVLPPEYVFGRRGVPPGAGRVTPTPIDGTVATAAQTGAATGPPMPLTPAATPPGLYPVWLDAEIKGIERSGPTSVSPKGAVGENQVMPETAAQYGVSREQLFNPVINDQVANRYRRDLWDRYHDPIAVKIAYNAGPGIADRWIASGRNSAMLSAETQKYIGVPTEFTEKQTQATQDLQKLRKRQDQIFDQLNQADPHSEERWQLAKQAMETGREYERKALELAERPPSATPIDSMQKLGGLATLVGILGGLLTKTPLTASLNAGGAAMEAYKANDQEAYKRNMDQFKFHVDALNNYAQFELGIYKDILEDERISSGERMNRLAHQASILGNEAVQIRAQIGDERATQQHIDSQRQARDALDERIRHDRAMEEKGVAGGKSEVEQQTRTNLEIRAKELGKTYDEVAADPQEVSDARLKAQSQMKPAGDTGLEGGKTDLDRQAKDILEKRAKDRGVPVDQLLNDPNERMSARNEAATQLGESRSPGVQMREQAQADNVVAVLDQADELLGLIDRGLTVGIGGKLMRPTESVENMLRLSDDTTRRQVESEISLLKITASRLLTNRSIVTRGEFDLIDKIVRGMSMGDTIQNTEASIRTLQKFILAKNKTLLKKYGYDIQSSEEVPSSATPSSNAPSPDQPWLSAPLAPGG